MKKAFILAPILILLLGTIAYAAPAGAPAESVWITPKSAKKGDKAELSAFVYNAELKTVTVSVLFATPEDEIATITLILPAQSAKTATTDWTIPAGQVTVTASVVKAIDASQKNVPGMLGPIGTVTVGVATASALPTINVAGFGVGAKSWFGTFISLVEPWRIEQGAHFTALRDQKRKELHIDSYDDITAQFETQPMDAPAVHGDAPRAQTASQKDFPLGSYAVLIYASALAAIFSSATVFYITAGLLILLILRLFIRMFS